MRLLLLGANGQVGWALRRSLAPLGDVIAATRSGGKDCQVDLADAKSIESLVANQRPDVIVNAAAYTAVDKAESEPGLAWRINTEAPAVLARLAREHDALLVHYSTDYVFDGSGRKPWREDDLTGPVNEYGRGKLAGEAAILGSGARHLIFRTSWVYAAHGKNFLDTMLRLAAERDALQVVDDQFGVPAGSDFIADATAHATRYVLAEPASEGLYHLTPAGETTWFRYARHVITRAREFGLPVRVADSAIEPVATDTFPTPAARPRNSRLAGRKLESVFGIYRPDWRDQIDRLLLERADRYEN